MKLTPIATCLLLALASNSLFAASPNGDAHSGTAADAAALATVMLVNDHEIKAASAAMKEGVTGSVKDYAAMMDTEHSANQAQTKELSRATGIRPAKTEALEAMKTAKKAERKAMRELDGAAFEAAYIAAMVKDHAEVLAKLDKEIIPAATNAEVVTHLKATRGHVAMHLEKAKALQAAVAAR